MGEEEVKILAANLFNKKLAASMYDAMEKAKSILNVPSQKKAAYDEEEFWRESRQIKDEQSRKAAEARDEPKSEKFHEELKDLETMNISAPEQQKEDVNAWEVGMNNEKMTLNELMNDGDSTEEKNVQDPKVDEIIEEAQLIKEEIKEAEHNPELIEQVKEDISQVKEHLRELEEEREMHSQEENNDNSEISDEEKKEEPV